MDTNPARVSSLAQLAEKINQLRTVEGNPFHVPASTPIELVDNDDLEPVQEQFRAGVMSLGWDPTTAQIVIEAYPLEEVDPDDDGFLALWGWIGDPLSAEELEGVDRVLEGLQGELGSQLAKLLTAEEIASFAARCTRLRSAGQFPAPSGDMPAVPWPLF